MRRPSRVPFVREERAHTVISTGQVILRLKTYWGYLEDGALDDIVGVTVELLRQIDSAQYLVVHEYKITILGNNARRQVVQDAIVQTLRGDVAARRAHVMRANEMLG